MRGHAPGQAVRGVVAAVRDPEGALFLKPAGAVGQMVPLYGSVTNEATVQRAVDDATLVVNLVGILSEPRSGASSATSSPAPSAPCSPAPTG